jgi:pimeloyl-ACP methyl ester carboxylesterase
VKPLIAAAPPRRTTSPAPLAQPAGSAPRLNPGRTYDPAVTFDWRGRHVAWQRTGSGPPVVLCHGTPFSSAIWRPFADALSTGHTVYAWDMPGYGASSKAAEHAVDLGVQGELLAELIAEWGLDRPHVIAHDFGGAVSLRAHLLHGARYRSLMLVDVVAIPPTGSPFFRFVQEHPGLLAHLPGYIHEAIVTAYIQGASHRGLRAHDVAQLVAPWTTAEGQPAFYRQIEQFDERYLEEIEPRLSEIDIPVRIVWGADDTWIAPDRGRRLRELIPAATLRLVDGAGHLVHYDAPGALIDEMRAWLAPGT